MPNIAMHDCALLVLDVFDKARLASLSISDLRDEFGPGLEVPLQLGLGFGVGEGWFQVVGSAVLLTEKSQRRQSPVPVGIR